MTGLPKRPILGDDAQSIAVIALRHCMLPHPETVIKFSGPVFPTIRDQKNRLQVDHDRGLLLDDNVTPRWALFWSHGIGATHHPKGWTIAHVWACPKDPEAYTHLANLTLLPESLGSLSDKGGPLCQFLEYHAYSVYDWMPKEFQKPQKPEGFDEISWQYFTPIENAKNFVHDRVMNLNNQRVKALRPLMGLE